MLSLVLSAFHVEFVLLFAYVHLAAQLFRCQFIPVPHLSELCKKRQPLCRGDVTWFFQFRHDLCSRHHPIDVFLILRWIKALLLIWSTILITHVWTPPSELARNRH